ncbi:Asp-tRNA(Asn)/Glu-tRNA(Gln) amidotransferase subunit GatA [Candidatus Borrarchaeum sp.]|uniref:Asp-tRNA(Asn)/Glu-tRNA(Gln) amidotransferase subunit GatA n=1 Tax=Candidatus Borrarchaeum sp. TaxID=2846742 RepID=UPI00257BFACA|nr:Asp-tRNA(Asn)/Glu-tRNA(Gln) amidotransferase subunit GatA [Candidatus Borrarchaeum sp.]
MDLNEFTAHELLEKLESQEISAESIVLACFEQIERFDKDLNAFITLTKDAALDLSKELDNTFSKDQWGKPLFGIPLGIKDTISTKGIRTTCGSKMLENYVPPYDAKVVELIKTFGMVPLGKMNMDEFAMGSSTESSYFGSTLNPWSLERVPGGSSGGSAAAVASDETIMALGTDTGGSIRCPASFCSVVGLKPTYGLVSRYGLIAYANSLEQIGPITKDVHDAALLLTVIAGYDPKDSTSIDTPEEDYTKYLQDDVSSIKIGVPQEFISEGIEGTDESVIKSVWAAIQKLENLGAVYTELSLPSLKYSLPAYYIIAMSEASSNLARYDGIRYGYRIEKDKAMDETISQNRRIGFGAEVRRRIMLGTYALSAGYYDQYYLKALKVRTIIKQDFEKAFQDVDVLIGPTMPYLSFKIGEKIDDPLAMYLADIYTVSVNLAGVPAISIPCGFENGLPIGLQIIGNSFKEGQILQVAYTFEQNTRYHKQKPDFSKRVLT